VDEDDHETHEVEQQDGGYVEEGRRRRIAMNRVKFLSVRGYILFELEY